jgi:hypothetical protein
MGRRFPINIWVKVRKTSLIWTLKRRQFQIRMVFTHQGEPSQNKVDLMEALGYLRKTFLED